MNRKVLAALAVAAGALFAGSSGAAGRAAPADPRAALLKLLPPGAKLDDLQPSPIPGVYEFVQGVDIGYLSADGRYFIDGNIYDMKTRRNLTELRRDRARLAMIDSVPESQMLIYSPPQPRYTITVFTDVDCPFCRKLHGEMARINALGVRVRYMFFPRTGPGTLSWKKAEAVWCSPDRKAALALGTSGAPLDVTRLCSQTPVAREYELGRQVGVRGTPAIITSTGAYIDGFSSAGDLLKEIRAAEQRGG